MPAKHLDTPFVTLRIDDSDPDVLYATYKEGTRITEKIAEQIIRDRKTFTENQNMLLMFYTEGLLKVDKAALDFLGGPVGVEYLTAIAMMRKNFFGVAIADMYTSYKRPRVPTKAFRNEKRALSWLRDKKAELESKK